ncbi:MAG: hypothetical protein ABJO27_18620 [Pseudoruegeria sp.]
MAVSKLVYAAQILTLTLFSATASKADLPVIEGATARPSGSSWTISVTLRHPDTGWDHYADGWEVLTLEGQSLGIRELTHPHETEQPFTRSLSGVKIPEGTSQIAIRARCSVDGWTGPIYKIDLN